MSKNAESPLLRVVKGTPDETELAALTAVIAAAAAAAAAAPADRPAPPRRSWWGDKEVAVRQPLHPGEGAWRASALPR
jgi:hypothetical protein